MPVLRKPSSVDEDIVWTPPMILGPGGPHSIAMSRRLARPGNRQVAGKGTAESPRVVWLSEPPEFGTIELERILMQEASRCGQAYVWVMMGSHAQSTISTIRTELGKVREMADDDPHATVRMGPDAKTCKLHGHLYLHLVGPTPKSSDPKDDTRVPDRLMTEEERNYVGGQPRHLWIWGPYSRESPAWPRSTITLPEPPFVRKPGR
ncbi:hypothetical protein ANO14919_071880 [Xylariales sp. No.14919]|nr:hypothetical protein ANO14919_071880 [Xylariales sp. No.14919]